MTMKRHDDYATTKDDFETDDVYESTQNLDSVPLKVSGIGRCPATHSGFWTDITSTGEEDLRRRLL